MAISVQTDLVMDVLRAGRSEEIAAARQKLQSMQPMEVAAAGAEFAAELLGQRLADQASNDDQLAAGQLDDDATSVVPSGAEDLRNRGDLNTARSAHEKFEAVVLEQFVKYLLPEDSEVIFGEGTAGEIWKGMMAQQLGAALSEAGGIGIAQQLAAAHSASALSSVLGSGQNPSSDPDLNRASNIIFSQQREMLDELDDRANTPIRR